MASLKFFKNRIKSIKSTQKLTKAMQLISASRFHKMREKLSVSMPYIQQMNEFISIISSSQAQINSDNFFIKGTGKDKIHLFIVVASDKGLCGSFNSLVVKKVSQQAKKLVSQGKFVNFLCIGKKANDLLSSQYKADIINCINHERNIGIATALSITDDILNLLAQNKFDVCHIFYNNLVTITKQETIQQQLIPLDVVGKLEDNKVSHMEYLYEPILSELQDKLFKQNLAAQIYHALLANSVSEHSARMTAMDNAARNSKEMLRDLNHLYNRTRQASITKELIEIISGAQAV